MLYLLYYAYPECVENYGYPLYKYKEEQANNLPNVEILFLGDSRVLSSVNSRLIPCSMNFALPGSTPIDTYYILEKILRENPKNNPKTVFFSFSWSRLGNEYNLDPILNRGAVQNFYNLDKLKETQDYSRAIDPEFFELISKKKFLLKKYRYPPELLNLIKSSLFLNRKKTKPFIHN